MRHFRSLSISMVFVLALLTNAAFAASATGSWKGDVTLPDGTAHSFSVHLKQDGAKVTGKFDGINNAPEVDITDGAIKDDTLTFTLTRQIQGKSVLFTYSGKISAGTIELSISRSDGAAGLHSLMKRIP